MNVILISYNYKPYLGGIETYTAKLKFFLENNLSDFYFYTTKNFKFKIVRILSLILLSLIKLSYSRPDIVHLTNLNLWPITLINIFKIKKIRFIINLHGLELVYGDGSSFKSMLYKKLTPTRYLEKNKNIIYLCNSNETLQLANKKFSGIKSHYIPMGVDKTIRGEQLYNKNQIFFLGRIVERKGLSWFVENILVHFKDLKLVFAGPIINQLEFNKIISSPQTEYLGLISDNEIIYYHQSSFLTIFPTLTNTKNEFEGFGISFIESISNGGLAMATLYQGLGSSSLNGKIGITVASNDSNEWIKAINTAKKYSPNERESVIHGSQKLIDLNFLWNDIFLKTIKVYEDCLKNNGV